VEVLKQFGGSLEGNFEIGGRTNVFWDGGSNPTSCIVTEAGMISFSRDPLFWPWAKIVGAAFCRKYQADRIGAAVAGVWFDGKSYYRKINDAWQPVAKDDFAMWLRTEKKLDGTKDRGTTHSETDQAQVFVHNTRRVDGVIPCLFDSRDAVEVNGKRFLNCSRVKPIQPHEERQTWATNFPWIARFLELRFDGIERQYFLGWWKRFYSSALQGGLLKGQSLFLVGPVNTGKTLMSHKLVGASVGGCSDATAHITKGTEFNKELGETALWAIDDGEVATDPRSHARFSEAVKRTVANPQLTYRAMYRDAQTIQWNGRLLVTLNDDGHSLNMIPDLATSMEEKVMVLRFLDTAYSFPPKHELEATIASELPAFCRWLVDWEMPDEIKGDNRLGVRSYINEKLRFKALAAGTTGSLFEVIDLWKKRNSFETEFWEGSASEWYMDVVADELLKPLIGKFGPKSIGKQFTDAARTRGSGIEVVGDPVGRGNRYRISTKRDGQKRAVRRVSFNT
jgi:hypothetical protein